MMTAKEMRRITELNDTSFLNKIQDNMIKCAKEGKSYYNFYTHKKRLNEATVKTLNDLGYRVTQLCSPPDEYIIEW